MPFDFQKTVIPPKTLAGLAVALRHKELWPTDFKWNYDNCSTCAMGLAIRLFGFRPSMKVLFSIPSGDVTEIFADRKGKRSEDITPEEIADRIEKCLAVGGHDRAR